MKEINLKKAAKILGELESYNQPVDLKQSVVKSLFESLGFDVDDQISGSHIVARHEILAELYPEEYTVEGRLTYPRMHGTKLVKRAYFKNILKAAQIVFSELVKTERGEESEADT